MTEFTKCLFVLKGLKRKPQDYHKVLEKSEQNSKKVELAFSGFSKSYSILPPLAIHPLFPMAPSNFLVFFLKNKHIYLF